ncbi:MAG: 5-oxoprolinase subunit PxpA [Pirellulales bacterium]
MPKSNPSIDLNGDVGEGASTDREFIPLLTSVNVACGGHAGDERTMTQAIESAIAAGVQVGAHPGFADREHFGRRELNVSADEVFALITRQLDFFRRLASQVGVELAHVKLHGALYHQAARDPALAVAAVRAIIAIDRRAVLVGPWQTAIERAADEANLRFAREGFADRAYDVDGLLIPRTDPRALITNVNQAVSQALMIAREGKVTSADGVQLPMPADTICLHGDNSDAIAFATGVRSALTAAGIALRSFACEA